MFHSGKELQKVTDFKEKITSGQRERPSYANPAPVARSHTFHQQKLLDWPNSHTLPVPSANQNQKFPNVSTPPLNPSHSEATCRCKSRLQTAHWTNGKPSCSRLHSQTSRRAGFPLSNRTSGFQLLKCSEDAGRRPTLGWRRALAERRQPWSGWPRFQDYPLPSTGGDVVNVY